jgi:hypothetical protein
MAEAQRGETIPARHFTSRQGRQAARSARHQERLHGARALETDKAATQDANLSDFEIAKAA